jgi:hypothetical protein
MDADPRYQSLEVLRYLVANFEAVERAGKYPISIQEWQ